MPSPQAVLKTLTTEHPLRPRAGFSAIAGSGALVGVAGPVIEGPDRPVEHVQHPTARRQQWSSSRRITEF